MDGVFFVIGFFDCFIVEFVVEDVIVGFLFVVFVGFVVGNDFGFGVDCWWVGVVAGLGVGLVVFLVRWGIVWGYWIGIGGKVFVFGVVVIIVGFGFGFDVIDG